MFPIALSALPYSPPTPAATFSGLAPDVQERNKTATMNVKVQETAGEAVLTLGDLLYADTSRPRIPEKDWTDLLCKVAVGDTNAFGTLYMWTQGIVFALAMRITHERAVAEMVTVEVFQDVWHKAATYDAASGTVVAWIMNLARSCALRARGTER